MVNISSFFLTADPIQPFIPSNQCFDWCVVQQVTHSNNLELYAVMFIVFSYIMIIGYFSANEWEALKPFRNGMLYLAKLSLIIFFAIYILVFRLRITW